VDIMRMRRIRWEQYIQGLYRNLNWTVHTDVRS